MTRVPILVVLCFSLTTAASLGEVVAARADAPESTGAATDPEARAAFEAGRDAYERGDFDSAVGHYERAYALSPLPALQFNIARAADSDGQPERAIAAYEAYLAAFPAADNRTFVEARITKMRELAESRAALARASRRRAPLPSVQASTPAEPVAPIRVAATGRDEGTERKPFWKRGWFWTVIGAGVAGSVTAAVLATRARDPEPTDADLRITLVNPR